MNKDVMCTWDGCNRERNPLGWFCREHYLLKEAGYAFGDIDSAKKWDNPEEAQGFREWAIERFKDLIKFYEEHPYIYEEGNKYSP